MLGFLQSLYEKITGRVSVVTGFPPRSSCILAPSYVYVSLAKRFGLTKLVELPRQQCGTSWQAEGSSTIQAVGMACSKSRTPLDEYSRSLQKKKLETHHLSMQYPMYTVRLEVVLRMTKVQRHQELLQEGLLCEFHSGFGKAMSLSCA